MSDFSIKDFHQKWNNWNKLQTLMLEAQKYGFIPPPAMIDKIVEWVLQNWIFFKENKFGNETHVMKVFRFDPEGWRYNVKDGFDLRVVINLKSSRDDRIAEYDSNRKKMNLFFRELKEKEKDGSLRDLETIESYITDTVSHELIHYSQDILQFDRDLEITPGLPEKRDSNYSDNSNFTNEENNEEFWPYLSDSIGFFNRAFEKLFSELLAQKVYDRSDDAATQLRIDFFKAATRVFTGSATPEKVTNNLEMKNQLDELLSNDYLKSFKAWKESRPEWWRKAVKIFMKETEESLIR